MSEMTPEKFYAIITKTALEFDEAERTGKPIPKDVENGQFGAWYRWFKRACLIFTRE